MSTSLFVVCITIVTVFALSVTSSRTLNKGISSVETDSVGVSMKADIYVESYSDSKNGANISLMAAWTGWPYTVEYSTAIHPGKIVKRTETQSRNSNFYLKLQNHGMNKGAHVYGRITAH